MSGSAFNVEFWTRFASRDFDDEGPDPLVAQLCHQIARNGSLQLEYDGEHVALPDHPVRVPFEDEVTQRQRAQRTEQWRAQEAALREADERARQAKQEARAARITWQKEQQERRRLRNAAVLAQRMREFAHTERARRERRERLLREQAAKTAAETTRRRPPEVKQLGRSMQWQPVPDCCCLCGLPGGEHHTLDLLKLGVPVPLGTIGLAHAGCLESRQREPRPRKRHLRMRSEG